MVLITYHFAGGNLKETGVLHWNSLNKGPTNNQNFNGLPNGNCDDVVYFNSIGDEGHIWTKTADTSWPPGTTNTNFWSIMTLYGSSDLIISTYSARKEGLSVRLIKD